MHTDYASDDVIIVVAHSIGILRRFREKFAAPRERRQAEKRYNVNMNFMPLLRYFTRARASSENTPTTPEIIKIQRV